MSGFEVIHNLTTLNKGKGKHTKTTFELKTLQFQFKRYNNSHNMQISMNGQRRAMKYTLQNILCNWQKSYSYLLSLVFFITSSSASPSDTVDGSGVKRNQIRRKLQKERKKNREVQTDGQADRQTDRCTEVMHTQNRPKKLHHIVPIHANFTILLRSF